MEFYVNENIKNTKRVYPEQGRYEFYRFDMNENAEGLPKEFVEKVLREITPEFLSVYPEPEHFLHKYAKYAGVEPDWVLAVNGSDMAIRYIFETFGRPGTEVVTVSPTFEMYRVNCSILGLVHVPVLYEKDLTITADKICRAISADTGIVVLINPNNPIGNVYSKEEAEQIIDRAEEIGAIVVIDEAYHYYYDETFIEFVKRKKNVIILRTFSKLFSLAACRLGMIISTPAIIRYIKNLKLTFDVNSIALLFGEYILDAPEMERSLIESARIGKRYILSELERHGYEYRNCWGNFVLIKTKSDPLETAKRLKEQKKILVHIYRDGLLREYLRVSIGSEKRMQFFVESFFEIDKG